MLKYIKVIDLPYFSESQFFKVSFLMNNMCYNKKNLSLDHKNYALTCLHSIFNIKIPHVV